MNNASEPGGLSVWPSVTEAGAPSDGGPDRGTAPHRILVVDDDPEIREIIAVLLKGSGYEVDTAGDGGAGWVALSAKPYDLLITDHMMPKLSGLGLLRRVRAVPMQLPCVLISGDVPWHERELLLLVQPGAIMEKPFSLRTLCDKVGELLSGSQACNPALAQERLQVFSGET